MNIIKYYGIEAPDTNYIWWIGISEHEAWNLFFSENAYRLPLELAIKAYQAIGYKCVELQIEKVKDIK